MHHIPDYSELFPSSAEEELEGEYTFLSTSVMVNSVCQPGPVVWLNTGLDIAVKVFLDMINIKSVDFE